MKQVAITEGFREGRTCFALCILILGALLALLAPARGVAQTKWTNDNSPVLSRGPGWESAWVAFVSVMYQDSGYVMWYSGGTNTNGINLSVGRATSSDGMHWTKDTLNPVMQHSASPWDGTAAWVPKVLKIGNLYTMWYTGSNAGGLWQIGRATSKDGRAWTKDTANPVLRVGAPGQWDAALVHTGSVLFDGTTYRMWYTGISPGYVPGGQAGIGLATSSDGVHWVKDTLHNPVLAAGGAGAWDAHGVGECSVVYDSTRRLYHMFYDGNELDYFSPGTSGIGYAFSADGIHWTKYAGNPVLANSLPGSWAAVADAPFVLLKDSTFHMWYEGTGGGGSGVGYATSPRILTGVAEHTGATTVRDFHLEQNYPNPFNPSTTIAFTLPTAGFVTLKVFDLLGNEVRTLVNGELSAGAHEARFNGAGFASGVYFYQLRSGSLSQTRKLILSR